MNFLFLLIFGYLIGSISPGYVFGRLVKGIDIRNYGYHNTGATNTYRLVGPAYGIITAAFDFLKAIFVYYISILGFWGFGGFSGLNPDLAILVGLAAMVGHVMPFYLHFKGGRGVASLLGLIFITLAYTQSFYVLLLVVGGVIYSLLVSRRVVFESPVRKLLKLSAISLPLAFIWLSRGILIWVSGGLLFGFIIFDLLRFLMPSLNQRYLGSKRFAKKKELNRLSGYTLFSISAFLLFLFFPIKIVVISLTFFILGDIFAAFSAAPLFLPQKVIIGDKTWSGVILILFSSLVAGIFLNTLTPLFLSAKIIILGALLTAFLDQFSFLIDDNILVPLGTAVLLSFFI